MEWGDEIFGRKHGNHITVKALKGSHPIWDGESLSSAGEMMVNSNSEGIPVAHANCNHPKYREFFYVPHKSPCCYNVFLPGDDDMAH